VMEIKIPAEQVSMASSTFHRRFKVIAGMRPVQFQKRMRLHEAQRLMLTDNLDASSASIAVGYENFSQFSREYKRLFGNPPRKDIMMLRGNQFRYPSIIFVIIYSVTWPTTLNVYAGFTGVSKTLRMVGRNYELSGSTFICQLLIPAALPNILTGLKIGWAFSWRTLIASELVFGVSSGSGGLGWFIYEKKNQLDIAMVFAGLIAIIIGLLMENLFFKFVENRTISKWGMKF
jgi:AraC-like DNA-binding protein